MNYLSNPDKLALFPYPEPKDENEHMDSLYKIIIKFLISADVDVRRIPTPGDTSHFSRFSRGGDIFLLKRTTAMVLCNPGDDSLLERGDSSPVRDSDRLSGSTVQGKKTEAKSIDDLRY